MRFTSATQLKDWIKNKSKQTGASPNVLLQSYMMERFLERISLSPYRENFILKGGFLIASMIGINRRTTMDMDATIKGLPINRERIIFIMEEIISQDANDGLVFEIQSIEGIRDISEYDDYRISLRATFLTIKVNMKIDITTGDSIIPHEIEYPYKLMFEDRTIPVMSYNLNTILAEKIETILSRNVANSRGRDFYDVYILLSMNRDAILREDLLDALRIKSEERGSIHAIENRSKHMNDIRESPEINKIWSTYAMNNIYAKDITLIDILDMIDWVFIAR